MNGNSAKICIRNDESHAQTLTTKFIIFVRRHFHSIVRVISCVRLFSSFSCCFALGHSFRSQHLRQTYILVCAAFAARKKCIRHPPSSLFFKMNFSASFNEQRKRVFVSLSFFCPLALLRQCLRSYTLAIIVFFLVSVFFSAIRNILCVSVVNFSTFSFRFLHFVCFLVFKNEAHNWKSIELFLLIVVAVVVSSVVVVFVL